MQAIIQQLRRLQRTSRALLLVQRLAILIACVGSAALLIGLLDFARPMSTVPRVILLALGLGAIGWFALTSILRAARFTPNITDVALRIERQMPSVAGRLASSVEFAETGIDKENALAARVVRETERRLSGESFRQIIRTTQTLNCLAVLVAVALVLGALVFTLPGHARIGAQRVLLPWSDVAWPARTGVRSLMDEIIAPTNVYERGKALLLRAEVTRGDDDQRVDAMLRYQVNGSYERWQQLVLTHQSDGRQERLVDTDATAVEIFFRTADARTDTMRIELAPAPAIERATLTVAPPAYAEAVVPTLTEELGPGIDDRSVASFASFIGSEAELVIQLNKDIPVPGGSTPSSQWIRNTFDWTAEQLPEFTIDPVDRQRWQLRWRVTETADLDLQLTDQYGLTNGESITYRIAARTDRVPNVTITEPVTDQVVLPTAVVDLQADAEDDVALNSLAISARLHKAISDQSAESDQPPTVDEEVWTRTLTTADTTAVMREQFDLSSLELDVGDVVLVTAYATDQFDLDGVQHAPAESAVRRLQVISELEYAEQIRRQLGGIRQNTIRIETLQGELQDDVIDDGVQPGVSRAQAQIGQRIAEQREMIQQLRDDLKRNRLSDEQLDTLLDQSGDLLEYAGRASTQAAQQIEQQQQREQSSPSAGESQDRQNNESTGEQSSSFSSGDSQSGPEPNDTEQSSAGSDPETDADEDDPLEMNQPAEEDRTIVDAQQQVRDELADLIELLDRDEDTWVITRRIENLLQQQQELADATQQLSEQTVGRSTDELTNAERSELERIVERQQQLADQARDVIEESRQRAEALEEIDPQSAEGMRNASRTAEQRELDQDMQRAAQRAEQNQLNSARASQQAAAQTMQQMLEEIEQTKRAQAEQLLRQLASLLESIKRLVTVQENELIALAQAQADDDYDSRDRAMIRLNQNTIAVEGEARAAGQQARRIARALDRAGDAQGAAVTTLRAEPIDHDAVLEAEERSLVLLKEAQLLAEELEQQVQEDEVRRQREGLIEQYRALSEKQLVIRRDTNQLADVDELDRRQLVESRQLGNAQDQIRVALLDMQAATDELREARVFAKVHELMNDWSEQVSQSLWDGDVTTSVTAQQQRIAESIGLLIDALNETLSPPDEFAENQSGDSGGGAGTGGKAPLIPPVAELKLIRGMQEQIYDQTRDIDAGKNSADTDRRLRLRELGRMQRELLELGEALIEQLKQQQQPQMQPQPSDATPDEKPDDVPPELTP